MGCSTPGLPVPHYLLESAQVHVRWIGDAIQPSHPLSPSSPSAFSLLHSYFVPLGYQFFQDFFQGWRQSPYFVPTASALPDVRGLVPGNWGCPCTSLSLPLVWKLHEGGVCVSCILSTPGSSGCPINVLLPNPQVCEWRPPEELKRLLDLELRDTGEPHHRLLERCRAVIRYSVKTSKSAPVPSSVPLAVLEFSLARVYPTVGGFPGGSAVKNLPAVQET